VFFHSAEENAGREECKAFCRSMAEMMQQSEMMQEESYSPIPSYSEPIKTEKRNEKFSNIEIENAARAFLISVSSYLRVDKCKKALEREKETINGAIERVFNMFSCKNLGSIEGGLVHLIHNYSVQEFGLCVGRRFNEDGEKLAAKLEKELIMSIFCERCVEMKNSDFVRQLVSSFKTLFPEQLTKGKNPLTMETIMCQTYECEKQRQFEVNQRANGRGGNPFQTFCSQEKQQVRNLGGAIRAASCTLKTKKKKKESTQWGRWGRSSSDED
jgi:hypothetical protein